MNQKIVILTEDRYENPKNPDWYINNILKEDHLLLNELTKIGFLVKRVSWSSRSFDWNSVDYAVFRTTWDYFERLEEFLNWINLYSKKIKFINSVDQIIWNLDKNYLVELKSRHIPIVPSLFLKKKTVKN